MVSGDGGNWRSTKNHAPGRVQMLGWTLKSDVCVKGAGGSGLQYRDPDIMQSTMFDKCDTGTLSGLLRRCCKVGFFKVAF